MSSIVEARQPLYELINVGECFTMASKVVIDEVKVNVELKCYAPGKVCIRLEVSGYYAYTAYTSGNELEQQLKDLSGRVWWKGSICGRALRDRELQLQQGFDALMEVRRDPCYVCTEYADKETRCGHNICTKCFLKSISFGTFTCGVCRKKVEYVDEEWYTDIHE